jgi:hypothetical protein
MFKSNDWYSRYFAVVYVATFYNVHIFLRRQGLPHVVLLQALKFRTETFVHIYCLFQHIQGCIKEFKTFQLSSSCCSPIPSYFWTYYCGLFVRKHLSSMKIFSSIIAENLCLCEIFSIMYVCCLYTWACTLPVHTSLHKRITLNVWCGFLCRTRT